MEPKLSVIVPVYNGEKYLRMCLISLLKQALSGLEIIIVNNGSQDESQKIIDEYAKEDSRIRQVSQYPNVGPAQGRNIGLSYANGEYIAFCDCDDEIPVGAYEMLYQKAKETDSDIIVADYEEITGDRDIRYHSICTGKKNAYVICEMGALWNKIYKRSFLERNGLKIPDYIGDEDLLFLALVLQKSPTFAMLDKSVYRYYTRADNCSSQMKTFTYAVIRANQMVRLQYDEIISSLGYEAADVRAFYSFRYMFRKWCQMSSKAEQEEAFRLLQEFVELSDWKKTAGRFKSLVGARPDEFSCSTYEEFINLYHTHCINVISELEETKRNIHVKSEKPPEIQTADMFRQGKLGFRCILGYFAEWYGYKMKRIKEVR